jgi:cardiolipin synthase
MDFLTHVWPAVSAGVVVFLALFATGHVLLRKRDVRAAIGWVGLIWLAPFVGVVLYSLLGINRIRRRAAALGFREPGTALSVPEQIEVDRDVSKLSTPTTQALHDFMDRVVKRPLVPGNAVRVLTDGDEAYPAMLAAIDEAKRSVSFSTYLFDAGPSGRTFIEALGRAHKRGVAVRVLIDAVGSRYSFPPAHHFLRREGVKVARFLPALLSPWFNLRNHRKIMVVDGVVGFTGGINIREEHVAPDDKPGGTHDTHFELRGPVVAHLQEAFAQDWAFATKELLTGPAWFPQSIPHAGALLARGVADGPDGDFERFKWTLLGAVACARRSVRVMTPYFLPEHDLATALNVAAMRGVKVEIVIPEHGNLPVVQWAMWSQLRQVIGHGCQIYATPRPFDHSKLMVVDGIWALVGSANWDPRSLRINFEFVVEIYGPEIARELDRRIDARIERAREITQAWLDERPILLQLRDGVARLFSPYL